MQKSKNSSSLVKFFLTMSLVAFKQKYVMISKIKIRVTKKTRQSFVFVHQFYGTRTSYLSHGRFVDVPVDPGEYLHLVCNKEQS